MRQLGNMIIRYLNTSFATTPDVDSSNSWQGGIFPQQKSEKAFEFQEIIRLDTVFVSCESFWSELSNNAEFSFLSGQLQQLAARHWLFIELFCITVVLP
ncbi:hypothetical protein CDAR_227471 [Caerostris darwini]|uniref:Uncharacterized protein n=1 Tax=Caerostris darwini TaxID=1538125 RepID=A0AAV4ULV3_9ARAC|nr:hypothetical protein CDAR_227471 [Caerostris darwini]